VAELVFAYGTLRPALWPEALRLWLASASCVGRGSVRGRLYDFGPHPAGVLDLNDHRRIHGEVIALPDEPDLLKKLDEYEGYDPDRPERCDYVRITCRVWMTTGQEVTCWLYAYTRDPGSAVLIPHGDYVLWRQEAGTDVNKT
jgi:gamma-glutamylcyclotransferase (GGCT)/AIG2-like uncharacterized protein YtfP